MGACSLFVRSPSRSRLLLACTCAPRCSWYMVQLRLYVVHGFPFGNMDSDTARRRVIDEVL